jgi:NAD(P)H dehydrogenase (quinone)
MQSRPPSKSRVVIVHPRPESLAFAVADARPPELVLRGHEVEGPVRYRERVHPVLGVEDEPGPSAAREPYSTAARAEMARIERIEATVLVFPVWCWSMPAMRKGWIDRV